MATSRQDYQGFVSEARRAPTEADELCQERDPLSEHVSSFHRQTEQLRATWAEILIRTEKPRSQSNSTSKVSFNSPDSIVFIQSTPNKVQPATLMEQRMCLSTPKSETAVSSLSAQMGVIPRFAIIPIMVLLCTVMAVTLSKFVE
ncbi:hypothetical protein D915_007540 [Fasciola hepatica]|uniref:Uncharacterized protein n=1 Tax=Fasciola hepatica TaxID=6192 RepID=A0A4E0R3E7_FASHE|nr:hypothetical protein D915_007540 [Fasciola hepatica]